MEAIQCYTSDMCMTNSVFFFENFHEKLNKLHKSIKFSYEQCENEILFLKVKISLAEVKTITKIHKK